MARPMAALKAAEKVFRTAEKMVELSVYISVSLLEALVVVMSVVLLKSEKVVALDS